MVTPGRAFAKLACVCIAAVAVLAATAIAGRAELDRSFSGNGTVLTRFDGKAAGSDVAVQGDGRIVAVGSLFRDGGSTEIAVARYNRDGTLDRSFGAAGKVTIGFDSSRRQTNDLGAAVAIQPNGRIVVVGETSAFGAPLEPSGFAVLRLTRSGELDRTFSGDGRVRTDLRSEAAGAAAEDVAVQPDGGIVVVGSDEAQVETPDGPSPEGRFAIVRYEPDGSLDGSFAGDGTTETDFHPGRDHNASDPGARAVTLDGAGRIVVAGTVPVGPSTNNYDLDFAIARYRADGSLDASFAGDGKLTTDFEGRSDIANAIAIQRDGRILAAGYGSPRSTNAREDFALARYHRDGRLDRSFSGNGKVRSELGRAPRGGDTISSAEGIAIDRGGRVVAAGDVFPANDFALVRYRPDGSLDRSFGRRGVVTTAFRGRAAAGGLAVAPSGDLVLAGTLFRGEPLRGSRPVGFLLARYDYGARR